MADYGTQLQFGLSVTPEADDTEGIIDLVQLADTTGLDLVAIQDHAYNHTFLDTWTLIAFLAAKTRQIHFIPDVADLPLRPPPMLAKAVATLDRLTDGRCLSVSTVQLNDRYGRLPSVAATRQPAATRSDRRAQIVRVAYQLVAERGLEGLRFADVARGAGINNGTLLYYFSSKDELVKAVGALLVEEFMQVEDAALPAREPGDPLDELRHEFADARLRLNHQSAVVYTELLARAQRDPSVADLLRDIDAGWRNWLKGLLEKGRARGQLRADMDAGLAATTIMASIRGVGMQALADPRDASVGPAMDAVATLIEKWIVA